MGNVACTASVPLGSVYYRSHVIASLAWLPSTLQLWEAALKPDFTVTTIDDGSTDATPRLFDAWKAHKERVYVYRIEQLPDDWAGKTHALHTGIELTCGEWALFTNADTWHAPYTLRLMMGYALQQKVDLLSMRSPICGRPWHSEEQAIRARTSG